MRVCSLATDYSHSNLDVILKGKSSPTSDFSMDEISEEEVLRVNINQTFIR